MSASTINQPQAANIPPSQAQQPTNGNQTPNIRNIKNRFRDLTLAIASRSFGSVRSESGANRTNTQDNNVPTNAELSTKNIFQRNWARIANVAAGALGNREMQDRINLDMLSGSIYSNLNIIIANFNEYFDRDGQLNIGQAEFDNHKAAISTQINQLFDRLPTSLDNDEVESCKDLLKDCFGINNGHNNLQAIYQEMDGNYVQLQDNQYRTVGDDTSRRTKEVITKFVLGFGSKALAVASAPATFGLSFIAAGFSEAGLRGITDRHYKVESLDSKVEDLHAGLNEELASLYDVDRENETTALPAHDDQLNKRYSRNITSPDFVDPLDVLLRNSLNTLNPQVEGSVENTRRYAYIWLKHVDNIRKLMASGEARLSAATFKRYNQMNRDTDNFVNQLRANAALFGIAPNSDENAILTSLNTVLAGSNDNSDRIAHEIDIINDPLTGIRTREAAAIEGFNVRQRENIRRGANSRFRGEFGMCTLGAACAVLTAGIASMAENLNGVHDVVVTKGEAINSLGQNVAAGNSNGLYINLADHIQNNATASFGARTGLGWSPIDELAGHSYSFITENMAKMNNLPLTIAELKIPVISDIFANSTDAFNALFSNNPGLAEAKGAVFSKGTELFRQYDFDANRQIFANVAKAASWIPSIGLALGVVRGAVVNSNSDLTGVDQAIVQGPIPPKFEKNKEIVKKSPDNQNENKEQSSIIYPYLTDDSDLFGDGPDQEPASSLTKQKKDELDRITTLEEADKSITKYQDRNIQIQNIQKDIEKAKSNAIDRVRVFPSDSLEQSYIDVEILKPLEALVSSKQQSYLEGEALRHAQTNLADRALEYQTNLLYGDSALEHLKTLKPLGEPKLLGPAVQGAIVEFAATNKDTPKDSNIYKEALYYLISNDLLKPGKQTYNYKDQDGNECTLELELLDENILKLRELIGIRVQKLLKVVSDRKNYWEMKAKKESDYLNENEQASLDIFKTTFKKQKDTIISQYKENKDLENHIKSQKFGGDEKKFNSYQSGLARYEAYVQLKETDILSNSLIQSNIQKLFLDPKLGFGNITSKTLLNALLQNKFDADVFLSPAFVENNGHKLWLLKSKFGHIIQKTIDGDYTWSNESEKQLKDLEIAIEPPSNIQESSEQDKEFLQAQAVVDSYSKLSLEEVESLYLNHIAEKYNKFKSDFLKKNTTTTYESLTPELNKELYLNLAKIIEEGLDNKIKYNQNFVEDIKSKKIELEEKPKLEEIEPKPKIEKLENEFLIADPFVVKKIDLDYPNRESEDVAFKSESAFGVLDGIGSGYEDSGFFAKSIAEKIQQVDFKLLKKEEISPTITKIVEELRLKFVPNTRIPKIANQIGCTLAMTVQAIDGKYYSVTAGDSHVWAFDADGKKIFSSLTDNNDEGYLTNCISYSHKMNRDFNIIQIPSTATKVITVSDGYDKLVKNIPVVDQIISDLIKSGKSATEIQKSIAELWEVELKKDGQIKNGFGADDFSFVCAQINTGIPQKQVEPEIEVQTIDDQGIHQTLDPNDAWFDQGKTKIMDRTIDMRPKSAPRIGGLGLSR